jgi:enoyl-[acyl-carrier protein] reductase I
MGASAAAGMQMVAARPCIPRGMLASRAAVSRADRALSIATGFACCPKISCSGPLSSKCSGVVVRAMSGESGFARATHRSQR